MEAGTSRSASWRMRLAISRGLRRGVSARADVATISLRNALGRSALDIASIRRGFRLRSRSPSPVTFVRQPDAEAPRMRSPLPAGASRSLRRHRGPSPSPIGRRSASRTEANSMRPAPRYKAGRTAGRSRATYCRPSHSSAGIGMFFQAGYDRDLRRRTPGAVRRSFFWGLFFRVHAGPAGVSGFHFRPTRGPSRPFACDRSGSSAP